MFRSYFKIAWRNLIKNKGYSTINIVGLATGMAVATLIGLWIWDEFSFDRSFKNHDRLAQVMLNQTDKGITYTGGTIAPPIAEPIRTAYSAEVKASSMVSWNNQHVVAAGETKLLRNGMWVQAEFPSMFSLDMLAGNINALKDPSSILVNHSVAKALFGDADPINKTIRIDNRLDFIIAGVFSDFPSNTTFGETTYLMPWDNKANWVNTVTDWDNHCCQLFVLLADQTNLSALSEKIKTIPTAHIKEWQEEIMLHPMNKLHLYDEFTQAKATGGRIQFVWLIGTIGGFVLLLACINFMNLSTARSEKRAKEVGIRKTIGSVRGQLVGQFLSESVVVALISFLVSLVLAQLALPFFSQLAGKPMVIPWTAPLFWLLLIGFALFTGIISGSYPAFYLSAFRPVKVLKGTVRAGHLATLPRKMLVVAQFTISVSLIIGTMIVFRQIEHAKSRLPGFSRKGLITVYLNTPDLNNHYDAIRNDLMRSGAVENMARSSMSPAHFANNNGVEWKDKDPGLMVFFRDVTVTPEYGQTIGWSIADGRDFYQDSPADSASVIFNEAAIKVMGFKSPLGEQIKYGGKQYTIVGVVKDMVTQSPYEPIEPALFVTNGWLGVMVIKLNPILPIAESLAKVQPVFQRHNTGGPFDFSFVDQEYGRKFSNEERIGNLAGFFAVLAIFISCLGLFGLSSFVAEQRTKEIGIRKVLGASVTNLWKLLSTEFVVLIFISCLISIPATIFFMTDWLENFQYRTTITWQVLAAASIGSLIITVLTVSFQAIRASIANPVTSLRTE